MLFDIAILQVAQCLLDQTTSQKTAAAPLHTRKTRFSVFHAPFTEIEAPQESQYMAVNTASKADNLFPLARIFPKLWLRICRAFWRRSLSSSEKFTIFGIRVL